MVKSPSLSFSRRMSLVWRLALVWGAGVLGVRAAEISEPIPYPSPEKADREEWWAWRPPQAPPPPKVRDGEWPRGDVDYFILSGLEARGLSPVEDADNATLIRRVYFDLIGLPPTPEQARKFLLEPTRERLEKVVDGLIASREFGERWGRHWLDVARYAESTGKEINLPYPHAWRYRDYVIESFAEGKPYDQFIREQVAGDLLPAADDRAAASLRIATGFLALGAKSVNERDARQFYLDVADEQIDAVSAAFLGMTISCARCHDHKFDPISQREYYAFAGIFTSTDTRYGTLRGPQNRRASELVELPREPGAAGAGRSMSAGELARKRERLGTLRARLRELAQEINNQRRRAVGGSAGNSALRAELNQRRNRITAELGALEGELARFDESGEERPLAMGVQDLPAGRRPMTGRARRGGGEMGGRFGGERPGEFSVVGDCAFYARGEPDKPGEAVPRGFPKILTPGPAPVIPDGASGRKELAEWLTSERNPLTARVFVNRVWGWLFGQGLVATPDNFGMSGSLPVNQPLLDFLAVRFMEGGWSPRQLIREIVLSRAYQLSSRHDEACFRVDPDNTLIWRMTPRRLEAECLRDAMLAASGLLEPKPGASAVAAAGERPIGGRRSGGLGEEEINGDYRFRSVYLPVIRDVLPESLALFDFPEPALVTGRRETTSVPSQALYLFNGTFAARAAEGLARWLHRTYPASRSGGGDVLGRFSERIEAAYWRVLSRPPDEAEIGIAVNLLRRVSVLARTQEGGNEDDASKAAWTSLCRGLFASAEFRYLF